MGGGAPDGMADEGEEHPGCCCGLVRTLRGLFTKRSHSPAGSVAGRALSHARAGKADSQADGEADGKADGKADGAQTYKAEVRSSCDSAVPDASHNERQPADSVECLGLNTAGEEHQGAARPRAARSLQSQGEQHADSLGSTHCEMPSRSHAGQGVSVDTACGEDGAPGTPGVPEVLENAAEDGPVYWYCVVPPPGHHDSKPHGNRQGSDEDGCSNHVPGGSEESQAAVGRGRDPGTAGGARSHHAAGDEGTLGAAPPRKDTVRAESTCGEARGKVITEARPPRSYTIWLGHRTPTPLEKSAAAAKRQYAAADRAAARKMAGREDAAAVGGPPARPACSASHPQVTQAFHLPAACRLGLSTALATLQRRHQVLVQLTDAGRPGAEGRVTGCASRVKLALRDIHDTLDRISRQQEWQASPGPVQGRARGMYPH